MAYILAVNPSILSASGMDPNAILTATALASFIGCIAMALLANYPFALAPGLGLNAFFAYTVCGSMGYPWQFALFAVFAEGLVFIVLSLTNVREAIFNAIPLQLKKGVSVGIGLFCAFIGLQNANIVVGGATLVTLVNFRENFTTIPSFATAPALIFVGFLMISAVVEINFSNMTESIPAYLCLLCMPLTYSISEGIAIGVISYVVINVAAGKAKKITPLMYVLSVLFVLKYILL